MNKNIFKDNCQQYQKKGFSVIPCMGEEPAINNWKDYCRKLPSNEEINLWRDNYPNHNIALLCGKVSGVTVIVCSNEEYAKIKELFPTPVVASNGEEYLLFYKYNREKNESFSLDNGRVIKFLSDGDLCLLPPSYIEREDSKNA